MHFRWKIEFKQEMEQGKNVNTSIHIQSKICNEKEVEFVDLIDIDKVTKLILSTDVHVK